MRILIVDGCPRDEARLAEVLASRGLEGELERLSCLASPEPDSARVARALLLTASWAEPESSVAVFDAIRGDPYFDDTLLFAAVTAAGVWTLGGFLGFDDFVVPPCRSEELAGRIRAAELRRDQQRSRSASAPPRGMIIDRAAHQVSVDARLIQLTSKEFALFSYFCENVGRALSRRRLVAHVWGQSYQGGLRTVDVHVRRLRIKFGALFPIETLRNSGYRLRPGTLLEPPRALPEPRARTAEADLQQLPAAALLSSAARIENPACTARPWAHTLRRSNAP